MGELLEYCMRISRDISSILQWHILKLENFRSLSKSRLIKTLQVSIKSYVSFNPYAAGG